MGKQSGLAARDTAQPLLGPPSMAAQAFELACRPSGQFAVNVLQGRVERRLVEGTVVVDPPADDRIEHPCQIVKVLVAAQLQPPASDLLANRLGGLVADRRTEVDEVFAPAVLRSAWAKGVAQKIEAGAGVLQTPIVVFAVDDLGLLRMELQSALGKTPLQRGLEGLGLVPCPAVAQRIVRIPLKRDLRVGTLHPRVEGVVQEQVRQQW